MAENDKGNDGFNVSIYSQGNFIAREMTFSGPINIGTGGSDTTIYSDEQVARALESIVGRGKPINAKWKWAGAYWFLRWACAYPVDVKDFCDKANGLPFSKQLEVGCDYRNVREVATLSFMGQDPRQMDKVKPSTNDLTQFAVCREIVLKLAESLTSK